MARTAAHKETRNESGGVGGVVKFGGKEGLRTVNSRPANIYMIYATCYRYMGMWLHG